MPLETASFISDLVTSNPAASDGLNNADDHMRLIKGVLKTSFPNFDAALAASPAALDASVAATSNGVSVLNDNGARFKTNTKDGIENPSAGKVAIVAQDAAGTPVKQTIVEFTGADKKATFKGPLAGGTGQLVPIGGTLLWWDTALPSEGGYCWANGGTLSRTDNPILWARWGVKFGAGDGTTTFNVPNLCEVVPVGNSTMGGVAARGIITHFTTLLMTTIGGWFGESRHTLIKAELPNTTFAVDVPAGQGSHTHGYVYPAQSSTGLQPGGASMTYPAGNVSGTTAAATLPALTGTAASGGSDAPINVVQPSAVVNWIIKIG